MRLGMTSKLLGAATLALALILAGCSSSPSVRKGAESTANGSQAPAQATASQPSVASLGAAPDFTITPIGSNPYVLSGHKGNVVVLYFMAAWCATCIPEAQALGRIHEQYRGRGVDVIIVDVDPTESQGDLLGFKERYSNVNNYWAMDTGGRVARVYGVQFLDTTVIIDRQGRIAYKDFVSTPYTELREEIKKLL